MFTIHFHRLAALAGAVALALLAWQPPNTARADEPQSVIVALLFPVGETPPECLDDPIGIIFGAGSTSNSTQKTLSSTFGEPFGNENLNGLRAVYVSHNGILEGVVRGFSSAPPPSRGFMKLGPNSDAEVLYCGRVSDNSNVIEPDEEGAYLLVIVAGTVR